MKLLFIIQKRACPSEALCEGGFSLIEVLVVAAIFVSITFVVTAFRGNLDTLQNYLNQKLQSRQDLDQAMQIMASELRSAGPSSLGGYAIESATSSSFTFYSDINKDNLFERVRYFLSTSTVRKGVIKPTGIPLVYATSSEIVTVVAQNVVATSTPLFQYYNDTATNTINPMAYPLDVSKIRIVQVTIRSDINASTTPQPALFTNTVTLRNLRSN